MAVVRAGSRRLSAGFLLAFCCLSAISLLSLYHHQKERLKLAS